MTITAGARRSDGWISVAELAADPLPAVDQVAAVYGAPRVVGGTFLLARVARAVAEPTFRAWLDGHPVPALRAAAVAIRLGADGRIGAVDFAAERVSEAPSGADVGSSIVGCMRPLVEALHTELSIGARGLWGLVADGVGGAAFALAADDPTALHEVRTVLEAMATTCAARPTLTRTGEGIRLQRGSCCLAFRLPDHGYCAACPVRRR